MNKFVQVSIDCWVSKTKPIKNIAEKDIICYKVFHFYDIFFEQFDRTKIQIDKDKIQKIYSEWMNFLYIPYKKQEHINLKIENDIIHYIIEEGYHSYSTFERAQYRLGYNSNLKIIECIIPKDSEYYVNSRDEVVSSNIIVTDKILN